MYLSYVYHFEPVKTRKDTGLSFYILEGNSISRRQNRMMLKVALLTKTSLSVLKIREVDSLLLLIKSYFHKIFSGEWKLVSVLRKNEKRIFTKIYFVKSFLHCNWKSTRSVRSDHYFYEKSTFFPSNQSFYLRSYNSVDFTENFWVWPSFIVPFNIAVAVSLVKTLFSRNLCHKYVRVKFRHFHTIVAFNKIFYV